jgi:hypothetical protein
MCLRTFEIHLVAIIAEHFLPRRSRPPKQEARLPWRDIVVAEANQLAESSFCFNGSRITFGLSPEDGELNAAVVESRALR